MKVSHGSVFSYVSNGVTYGKRGMKWKWLMWWEIYDIVGMYISSISDDLGIYILICIFMDYVYYTWKNAILELGYDWISNIV